MNIETTLAFVYDCLLSDTSIPQQLRMRQGLDQERFDQLTESLQVLIHYYNDKDLVPKRLALCFIDIYNAFFFREGFYNDSDAMRIENAGIMLQEIAVTLLE